MYTRGEELHSHAWRLFLPIPLVVASSLTVFLSYTLVEASTDNEFRNITFSFFEGYISSLQYCGNAMYFATHGHRWCM